MMPKQFHVSIHDVTPSWQQTITVILDHLEPLLDGVVSGAVVPKWHGEPLTDASDNFVGLVKERFGQVLLHGYTHQRPEGWGPLTWLTDRADELAGLPAAAAIERLQQGQAIMQQVFDAPCRGLVAPAWQMGHLTPNMLKSAGISYAVGLTRLVNGAGGAVPLATWSWDAGRLAALGYITEWLGRLTFAIHRHALPCLVFHPADVERGFLHRGLRLIRTLLDAGYQPILLSDSLVVK